MSYNFNFMLYAIAILFLVSLFLTFTWIVFYNGANRIQYKPPLCAASETQGYNALMDISHTNPCLASLRCLVSKTVH